MRKRPTPSLPACELCTDAPRPAAKQVSAEDRLVCDRCAAAAQVQADDPGPEDEALRWEAMTQAERDREAGDWYGPERE